MAFEKFHTHDGWFFGRDGFDVVIFRGDSFELAQEVVRFDPNTWASIVAHVSKVGETADSFKADLDFHLDGSDLVRINF